MINGFIISFVLLLTSIIVALFVVLYTKNKLITILHDELRKEQEFREAREDSLAELLCGQLALPPGKRRLCNGCMFARKPWQFGLLVKKREILTHNIDSKVKPDDIDDLLEVITIPIYEENLIKKLVNISGRTI